MMSKQIEKRFFHWASMDRERAAGWLDDTDVPSTLPGHERLG
jgi:hypothetical protein